MVRDFKGIWIPRDVWLSPFLSLMEKVIYVEIHSLDNERGCFASNGYFAKFFGVSERQIRTYIGSLRDKGFVTVTIRDRYQRVIRAVERHGRDLSERNEISGASTSDGKKPKRDFKGIWIPAEIWLSTKLKLFEKVLFVEVHSLDNEDGCFASNAYFAEFFKISERQLRSYLASLREKGFITVTLTNSNERVIRAAGKYARPSAERVRRFQSDYRSLVDKFQFRGAGVGRKLPGR